MSKVLEVRVSEIVFFFLKFKSHEWSSVMHIAALVSHRGRKEVNNELTRKFSE